MTGLEGTIHLGGRTADMVNHPPHYKGPAHNKCGESIECIDVVRHMPFDRGNAVKYIWRAGEKDAAKEIEDLEKAVWYLTDEITRLKALQ